MYEIWISYKYGPYEPYESGGIRLTLEHAKRTVSRLRHATSSGAYRYEIRPA